MQIISIISLLIVCFLLFMNYENVTVINLSNGNLTYTIDLAIYTFAIFILGILSVIFFTVPLYSSMREKFNAYKRELEKGSISNSNGEAKIKVLENKITVLEKALDDAIKKNK